MSRDKRALFEELVSEVRRSQSATARFDQAVADAVGLNRTDMRCVDVLHRAQRLTAGELARETGLSSAAMTAALDRLERAGFAHRVRDEADRRRVLVEPTGRLAELSHYYTAHQQQAERLYSEYTREQMELLLGFFRRSRELNEARAGEIEAESRSEGGVPARRAGAQSGPPDGPPSPK